MNDIEEEEHENSHAQLFDHLNIMIEDNQTQ